DGRAKVLDFGLAKFKALLDGAADDATAHRRTDPGAVIGTYPYMSPEQVRGDNVDQRSDIFSFGVVLFEMITARHPFRRETAVETMNAILKEDVAFEELEQRSAGVARVLRHALAKNPAHRFQSIGDLAYALEAAGATDSSPSLKRTRKVRRNESAAAPPSFEQVTFRPAVMMTARFADDGSIVYGAAIGGRPTAIFTTHPPAPESRPIGLENADVLDISPTGELAVSLGRRYIGGYATTGTLARMPLTGGSPREVCEDVSEARWTADGRAFLMIRRYEQMYRLESPIGTVLYRSPTWITSPAVSPKGDLIAFFEHPVWGDTGAQLVVIDRSGTEHLRSPLWHVTHGLLWSVRGDEVWVAATRSQAFAALWAVSLKGKERLLVSSPRGLILHDRSDDGTLLVSAESLNRSAVVGRIGGEEQDVTLFDWSWLGGLAPDGSFVVLEEQAAAVRGRNTVYLRRSDGSPAVRIGEGRARGSPVSPDGRLIAILIDNTTFELQPVGVGEPRSVPCEALADILWWQFRPDGLALIILGNEFRQPRRLYEFTLDGSGSVRALTASPINWPFVLSHDGLMVAAVDPSDRLVLIDLGTGEANPAPGCQAGDVPIQWSDDNESLFVYQRGRVSVAIDRVNLTTGERRQWHVIHVADPAGVLDIMPVLISADGATYAYGYRRSLSDLFLLRGLA
ncbi:MAG TPA: protein kinase, partial [Thermoanaerobaculia bacterium]|nr:protein kinase [Thermoanaerobaculia bacterium]